MAAIDIRELLDDDIDEVLGVLRESLGETSGLERTAELWSWKHEVNPFGRSLVLVATSAGAIVGVRAFMRWHLDTPSGERLECVRAVDTATHPEFLRRGIFRRLTLSAIEMAQEQGIDLIFNTPNSKSKPG
jgi:GNAT superfamily N-acetyltransferase